MKERVRCLGDTMPRGRIMEIVLDTVSDTTPNTLILTTFIKGINHTILGDILSISWFAK